MESLLASTDNDQLSPMDDYQISGPTASYVTDRNEATFFSNVTEAGPNSVRVVTWNISSDHFIHLNSLHFHIWIILSYNNNVTIRSTNGKICLQINY